jgi:hypothetical protein
MSYTGLDNTTFIDLKTGAAWDGPRLNQARGFHRMAVVRDTTACEISVKVYVFGGYENYPNSVTSSEMIEFTFPRDSIKPMEVSPQSLTLSNYVCEQSDTLITLRNPFCSDMTITAIEYPPFANGTLGTVLPIMMRQYDSITFTVVASSTSESMQNGNVTIHYITGGKSYSLIVPVSYISKPHPKILSRLDNRIYRGDTIEVPLYLFPSETMTVDGLELELTYNTDLLEPIEPRFTGTLLDGTQYYIQTFNTGTSRLTVPRIFLLTAQMPVVRLRFKSFVTDSTCTQLVIRSLRLDDLAHTKGNCALLAVSDSVLICREPGCGDDLIRKQLRHVPIRIERAVYDAATERVVITTNADSLAMIQISNILGKPVYQERDVPGDPIRIDVRSFPDGLYFVSTVSQFGVSTAKLMISR